MSRETGDRDYRPKRRIVAKRRTPGRSRLQVESSKYLECDSEGLSTVVEGDSQETDRVLDYHSDDTDKKPVDIWTPRTIRERTEAAEGYITEIMEHCNEYDMAKQTEKSNVDRMFEIFM